MNQKILGVVSLVVALLFIAVFAAGDNAAAAGSSSAGQTVTVTVQGNNQNGTSNGTHNNARRDIALKVIPTAITMTTDGHTDPLGGATAYSGTGPGNNNIIVRNAGSVTINVLVRSASTQFSDGNSNVFTPTLFTINSQGGSSVNILTTNTGIATNMPKSGSDSHFSTYLTLGIPFYVHAGNYQNPVTYTAIESN
jgi:hypothetical protein